MKKIFCLIPLLVCLVSCGNYNANHTGPDGGIRSGGEVAFQNRLHFYDIYHDGEWHEFVVNDALYDGGLSHWPGCRFCKEKNKETE